MFGSGHKQHNKLKKNYQINGYCFYWRHHCVYQKCIIPGKHLCVIFGDFLQKQKDNYVQGHWNSDILNFCEIFLSILLCLIKDI